MFHLVRSGLAYMLPMLSANTVLYSLDADAKCHWDEFVSMTPLCPRQVILAKYLLAYGNAALLTLAGLFTSWISTLGKGSGLWTLYPILFILLWAIMFLPLRYRFTRGQATFFMFLIWGVIAALLLNPGRQAIADFLFGWMDSLPVSLRAVIVVAAVAVLSVGSIKLSVRFYTRRQREWYD